MHQDKMDTRSRVNIEDWQPARRVEELACRLVGIASETGTPEEAAFADKLVAILQEIPYFQENPSDIRLADALGHSKARNVVAVVRGKGRKTLALTGHYDTVSVTNYHELAGLSRDPHALKDALIDDLSGRDLNAQETKALSDLMAGNFLPGRGMLDMKSGLAAGITVLERYASLEERAGNLMLCCSPDEERDSRGMRALRNWLPELTRDMQLDLAGAINMDVSSDQGDGSEGRAVFAGTIGKLMPFALVVGQSSHASYPYEGVSAQLVGAEILRSIEANPELCDQDDAAVSPPPICIEARDLRQVYEVTTPERTWLAFNWLYHSLTPEDLFARFRARVEAASQAVIERSAANARAFAEKSGMPATPDPAALRVITYAELRAVAAARIGDGFGEALRTKEAELKAVDNPLTVSRELTDWLVTRAGLSGPLAVVGFASLHYPATRLDPGHPHDAALQRAITETLASRDGDLSRRVKWRPYFEGISDMSFFGQPRSETAGTVAENTPAPWLIDQPVDDALRCPMVNIGPWGREFHQKLERVHMPYAFDELPKILAGICDRML
ncbi:M20/M25/M40 family metallo-hydrolase [Roseibium sp. M-1]